MISRKEMDKSFMSTFKTSVVIFHFNLITVVVKQVQSIL